MKQRIMIPLATLAIGILACKDSTTNPGTEAAARLYFTNFSGTGGESIVYGIGLTGTVRAEAARRAYLSSSPRGGVLVVNGTDTATNKATVVVLSADGAVIRTINADFGNEFLNHAVLAPDGRHIAAYAYDILWGSDSGRVYVMDIDGTNGHFAPTNAAYEARPAFSANGTRIVYYGSDRKVRAMNLDGTGVVVLASGISPGGDFGSHIEWSPLGDRIMFTGNAGAGDHTWLVNADGTGLTDLSATLPTIVRPTWSPDGASIACLSGTTIANIALSVAAVDGSNLRQLLAPDPGHVDYYYSWSPDGTKIAFTEYETGGSDLDHKPGVLKIIDVAGGAVTTLADSVYKDAFFAR